MTASNDNPTRTSLLGLPSELRLRIYEYVFARDGSKVHLMGTADGHRDEIVRRPSGSLSLPLVCRLIYVEARPMKPKIERVQFSFNDFTLDDAVSYIHGIGDKYAARMRKIEIRAWGGCGAIIRQDNGHIRHLCHFHDAEECDGFCELMDRQLYDSGLLPFDSNPTSSSWRVERKDGRCQRTLIIDLTQFNPNAGCFPSHSMLDCMSVRCCDNVHGLPRGYPECAYASVRLAVNRLLSTCATRTTLNRKNILALFEIMCEDFGEQPDSDDY